MKAPTRAEIEVRAKAIFDASPNVMPSWQQFSEPTKDVWRERAAREIKAGLPAPKPFDWNAHIAVKKPAPKSRFAPRSWK